MAQIDHIARIGFVTAPADETGLAQRLQIRLNNYECNDVTSFGLFGVASSPLPGAAAMVLNVSGNNSNGAIVATNDGRFRPTGMRGGETCVYDSGGQKVYLSNAAGVLSINVQGGQQVNLTASTVVNIAAPTINATATTAINATTPTFTLNGNLVVNGSINATGNMTGGGIDMINHRHPGIQAGGGITGTPVG